MGRGISRPKSRPGEAQKPVVVHVVEAGKPVVHPVEESHVEAGGASWTGARFGDEGSGSSPPPPTRRETATTSVPHRGPGPAPVPGKGRDLSATTRRASWTEARFGDANPDRPAAYTASETRPGAGGGLGVKLESHVEAGGASWTGARFWDEGSGSAPPPRREATTTTPKPDRRARPASVAGKDQPSGEGAAGARPPGRASSTVAQHVPEKGDMVTQAVQYPNDSRQPRIGREDSEAFQPPSMDVLLDLMGGLRGGITTSELKPFLSKPLSEISTAELLSYLDAARGETNSSAASAQVRAPATPKSDKCPPMLGTSLDLIGDVRGGAKNSVGSDLKSLLSKPLSEAQITELRSHLFSNRDMPDSRNVGMIPASSTGAVSWYPRDALDVSAATSGRAHAATVSSSNPGVGALADLIRNMRGNDLQVIIDACRAATEASRQSALASNHGRTTALSNGGLPSSQYIPRDGPPATSHANAAGPVYGNLPPGMGELLDLIGSRYGDAGNISTSEGQFSAPAFNATGASDRFNTAAASPTYGSLPSNMAMQHGYPTHNERDSIAASVVGSRTRNIDLKILELVSSRQYDRSPHIPHELGMDTAGHEHTANLLHLLHPKMSAAIPDPATSDGGVAASSSTKKAATDG